MDKFNPFQFEGRLGRLQYFGFAVIWYLIGFFVSLSVGLAGEASSAFGAGGGLLFFALTFVHAIATISYGVRRLHDFDKSGWWYLLTFVPLVNIVMYLVLLFAPPTPGANRYGVR